MTDRYAKYGSLKFDRPANGVLRICINRPERLNALTEAAHRELTDIWRDVDADTSVRAVILCGAGKSFSVGGEFEVIEGIISDFETRSRALRDARDLVNNIVNCSKPIVSAMQGAVAGGGLALGLLADISIATKTAKLVDGHTRLGVCAGDHAVMLWPLLCGLAKAKYYLLLCEAISGAKAEEIGLIAMAVEEADLETTALSVATRLANGSAMGISMTKHALNNWLRMAGPAFDASLAMQFYGFSGPDAREGLDSHREKRPPVFNRGSATE
jgi:enoyl-CoA hydratase